MDRSGQGREGQESRQLPSARLLVSVCLSVWVSVCLSVCLRASSQVKGLYGFCRVPPFLFRVLSCGGRLAV